MSIRNVSICCFASLLPLTAHATIRNTSFEQLTNGRASFWTHFGNVFEDQLVPRTGIRSLKQFGNFTGGHNVTGSFQTFSVAPGTRVNVTAWAFNRSADPIAGNNYAILRVIYRNAANQDLVVRDSKPINAATPRNQWQLISASLGDAPANATHCAVFLMFVQPGSSPFAPGAVQFDDVRVNVTTPKNSTLVWFDDFKGKRLDSTFWEPMIGDGSAYGIPGWGNNELQFYTSRESNLRVSDGLLRITARREFFGGRQFTSARIRTKGKLDFLYGRVEARMRVPAGQGLWSAFWMLPTADLYGIWAASGEIDVMETINSADRLYQTIHFGGSWPNNQSLGSNVFRPTTYADGFHTYAVEWEPDSIRWFINDVETYVLHSPSWNSAGAPWNQRAPFDQPFHLLLNLAVGGNWPGSPSSSTVFPAELQVDWVRLTQRQAEARLPRQ